MRGQRVFGTVLLASLVVAILLPNIDAQTGEHECIRTCKWPPEPKTCRYTFTVEWFQSMSSACFDCPFNLTDCDRPECIPINGVRRPIVTVNRQLPGPPIQVCEGDDLEVKVWNRLGNSDGTSIHWHAIQQRGTPYMDGATMITQCPISPQSSFTYEFKASPAGTQFWHSHSNLQRLDGAFGAFIVHQAPERDVHIDLYNYDLPEHVMFVQAWPHQLTYPFNSIGADSIVINGKGVFQEFSAGNETSFTPREVFTVKQGGRYRFRLIGNNACILSVTVNAHNLTVIATDGGPIKPIVVDHIGVSSGERYDFVITANRNVSNYWIRVQAEGGFVCRNTQEELAILRYEGAPNEDPEPDFPDDNKNGLFLNPPEIETPNGIDMVEVEPAVQVADDDKFLGEPDQRFYMALGLHRISRKSMYDPNDYPNLQLSDAVQVGRHINYVSFKIPPSPLLTQSDDIAEEEFCEAAEALAAREKCIIEYCSCIQIIKIELGQVVELVLVSESSSHPMHLHGHSFRVVGVGKIDRGTTAADVMELDQQGNINRTLENAVWKDTLSMESRSYSIIRFIADNPGWWLFHCHDIFHLIDSMAIVFQVGEQSDLPPVPVNFPRCGSWAPIKDGSDYNEKRRKNGQEGGTPQKMRKQAGAE